MLTAHVAARSTLHECCSRPSHVDGLALATVVANLKLDLLILLQAPESLTAARYQPFQDTASASKGVHFDTDQCDTPDSVTEM